MKPRLSFSPAIRLDPLDGATRCRPSAVLAHRAHPCRNRAAQSHHPDTSSEKKLVGQDLRFARWTHLTTGWRERSSYLWVPWPLSRSAPGGGKLFFTRYFTPC